MIDINEKKKKLLIIAAVVLVAVIGAAVFLDVMTNNGGRVTIIGAIIGVVAAAVILILGKVFSKDDDTSGAFSDPAQEEENRFKRPRRTESEEKPESTFTSQPDELLASRFTLGSEPEQTIGFEQPELSFEPAASAQPTGGADMSVPPSEQLRRRGFFGHKAREAEPEPEIVPERQPATSPAEENFVPESAEEGYSQSDWESDDRFSFEGEPFAAPVLSFGDPSDNEVPVNEIQEPETYEEPFEEASAEQFEGYSQPEQEIQEETAEPEAQKEIPEEPAPAAEPAAVTEPEAPKENVLLKDISEGMVVASMAPGQTLESFFDGMSEDDIVYRDCVEVWASGAKNPMIKLLKYVESIDDKKTAGLIGRECEYVNAMIDRMLYFSQLDMIDQALNMKEYNFSVLVKECLKRFSPFFMEKKIGLLWKGLDVNVVTDKRWFIFALTQVIFNSVEFTPQGGKIAISAKKTDDYIDLVIDDSGEGIDNEELPYVFTAGFMGDDAPNPDETRTGMGLFITRTVLQKLGGECMAESTKGKGTRIVMRLPAMKEEQTA